jgi:hypothetical protein
MKICTAPHQAGERTMPFKSKAQRRKFAELFERAT